MAVNEFVMPKLAMGMNEGTLQEWLFEDGEYLEAGQTLASIETEKVAFELEAPAAGYYKRLIGIGETVPVETPIAVYAEDQVDLDSAAPLDSAAAPEASVQEETAPPVEAAAPLAVMSSGERKKSSPLARKMAADRGIDVTGIQGTGPGGRVVKRDVLAAEKSGMRPIASGPLTEQARIPLKGIRGAIADNMMRQMQNTATISLFAQSDVTELLALRKALVSQEDTLGTRVSVNAIYIKAIAAAARRFPLLNASIVGEEIIIWDDVNVGFAITLPSGDGYTENLMVPVIKHADKLSLAEIDIEMKRLAGLAREGKIGATDMSDSTITFTTVAGIAPDGAYGNAILNGANAAIVGIGGAKRKPAEYQGEIALRPLAPVVLNYDHRLVDGAPASRFLTWLCDSLQSPAMMMA